MGMSADWAMHLYDRRMEPPEPEDYDWSPGFEAERAYYEAGPGAECPVCHRLSPDHGPSCFVGPESEPSYRINPADFRAGGRYDDKENA